MTRELQSSLKALESQSNLLEEIISIFHVEDEDTQQSDSIEQKKDLQIKKLH